MNLRFTLLALMTMALGACAGTPSGKAHWQAMAAEDLDFIRATIEASHPGPLDNENPEFGQWMRQGHERSRALLAQVKGYGSYEHVLRRYVNGFADEHLNLNFWLEYRWQAWSGVIIAWNGREFVVDHAAGNIELASGAELLGCDGRTAETLWQEDILPFHGRPGMPADRYRFAPFLLLDTGNPLVTRPRHCRFQVNGETREVTLSWSYTSREALQAEMAPALPGAHEPLGIRAFGDNSAWISLPSFSVNGSDVQAMKQVLRKLRDYRRADVIVVDVRGNGGGSSYWGELFVKELHGEAYAAYIEQQRTSARGPVAVDYRVSPGNLAHFDNLEGMIIAQAGEGSETHRAFTQLVEGLRLAHEEGEAFYRLHDDSMTAEAVAPTEPGFKGRVVFLTDSLCVSACLDFADRIASLPNAVHVGQPTSADTDYMEIRGVSLPSGNGKLNFATKVYRGDRGRPEGGYYTPEHLYIGNIGNTEAVERWIREVVLAE